MLKKISPFLLVVAGFILVLAVGLYFVASSGSYKVAVDPNCTVDLSAISDKGQLETADSRCRVSYNSKLFNDKISYNSWVYAHRVAAMRLQLYATALLLSMVVFIVFFGLVMSYLEFRKRDGQDSATTIKVGPANMEFSSTISGLVILSISLAFAYLYFDRAYKITEIATQSEANSDQAAKKNQGTKGE